jgi:TBC1 domain family member 8/9
MRRSASKSSLVESESTTIVHPSSSTVSLPSATQSEFSPLPMVLAANAALIMERTPFAIDDAKDDDDDEDYDTDEGTQDGEEDDLVLDEVSTYDWQRGVIFNHRF